jgi:carboxyl-terminal processing protease
MAMRQRLLPLLLALLVPAALAFGIWAGGHPRALPEFVRDALVDDDDAQVYEDMLERIGDDFYRRVDRSKVSDKALSAAVEALGDPFSRYITPEQYADFQASTEGNFEGVGMNVREIPRGLEVLDVFPDGPAAKAGLKAGDLIVAVDGKSLKGESSADATTEIKGPSGTQVELTIVSDGDRRVETLTRARVTVPVVRARMERSDGAKIGYVALAQFTAGAHGTVRRDVQDLLEDGAEGLVLDLRHNGGGLLQEGVLTASIFIGDGVITSTRGRNRPTKRYTATGDAIDTGVPLAVLVDGGTASASEIVTGALQDRDRATVVGTRTFGKGVFQEIEVLTNGGALDITVGEYFTPDGRNLGPRDGERGLTPDVRAQDEPKTKRDEALDRALAVVAADV